MFFIMGINSDYKKLNFIQNFVCPDCGIVGEYQVFVAYTVLSLFFIPIFKWGRKYYVQTSCCGKTYKLDNEVGRAIEKGEPVVISQNDLEYEGQTPVIKKCNYCGYVTEENFIVLSVEINLIKKAQGCNEIMFHYTLCFSFRLKYHLLHHKCNPKYQLPLQNKMKVSFLQFHRIYRLSKYPDKLNQKVLNLVQ